MRPTLQTNDNTEYRREINELKIHKLLIPLSALSNPKITNIQTYGVIDSGKA